MEPNYKEIHSSPFLQELKVVSSSILGSENLLTFLPPVLMQLNEGKSTSNISFTLSYSVGRDLGGLQSNPIFYGQSVM